MYPPTDGFPCRSRKDSRFYLRVSAGTFPMEYFQIADMFGKRRRPVLRFHLEEIGIEPAPRRANANNDFRDRECR